MTVYVVKVVMFENVIVFADVPSSTSEKFVRGEGEPVKGKDVAPFGVASLTIVIEAGKTTASAESERSCCPTPQFETFEQVKSARRM